MAGPNSTIRQMGGALAQRLLLVALFVFGFAEVPFGGENVTARTALETHRAIQLSASGEPASRQLDALSHSQDGNTAVLAGGDDHHATMPPAQPAPREIGAAVGAGGHAPLLVHTCHWFSSRAPPACA